MPDPLKLFKRQALAMPGIGDDQLVRLKRGWHRVESLMLCHAAQRSMMPMLRHVEDLVRALRIAAGIGDAPAQPSRRVYDSRARARRRIVNEKEIMPILRDYGFERFLCEDLSFADQVRIFAQTNTIFGPHGAGMNNDVLCPPGAKVIDLYPPDRWNHCVCRVANTMGHEHWHVFGHTSIGIMTSASTGGSYSGVLHTCSIRAK